MNIIIIIMLVIILGLNDAYANSEIESKKSNNTQITPVATGKS